MLLKMKIKQKSITFQWTIICTFLVTLLTLIGLLGLHAYGLYRFDHTLSSQLMTALYALGPIIVALSAFTFRKGTQFERIFYGALFGTLYLMFSVGIPMVVELILFRTGYNQDWMLYESMLSGAIILVGVLVTYKLVNTVDIK